MYIFYYQIPNYISSCFYISYHVLIV